MPKSTYHHGNLRQALLDAARQLLDESGPDGLSLRKVAQLAGVSAMAPYSHFEDKQALLAEIATEGFAELATAMENGAAARGEGARERIIGLAQGYVSFATGQPALFQLMFGPNIGELLASPTLLNASTRTYQLMEACVEELLQARENDAPVSIAAAGAWSVVHGLSTLLIDGRLQADTAGLPNQDTLVESLCSMLQIG